MRRMKLEMANNSGNWEASTSNKFEGLSARDVLEWMEIAGQFMKKFTLCDESRGEVPLEEGTVKSNV